MAAIVKYKNDSAYCFCQLRFESGERVLVSIALLPVPSVRIFRLALWGLIPCETLWELDASSAGGTDEFGEKLVAMFYQPLGGRLHPLDMIVNALLPCRSIDDLRSSLAQRQASSYSRVKFTA
jgi:hypothetical protein